MPALFLVSIRSKGVPCGRKKGSPCFSRTCDSRLARRRQRRSGPRRAERQNLSSLRSVSSRGGRGSGRGTAARPYDERPLRLGSPRPARLRGCSRLFPQAAHGRARGGEPRARATSADARHDADSDPADPGRPRPRRRGHARPSRADPGCGRIGCRADDDADAFTGSGLKPGRNEGDAMDTRDPTREARGDFLTDVTELRRRARQHIEDGAVTSGYGADRLKVIAILNEALATEIVCVLRYKRHYFMAQGIHAQAVAQEFLEHANEEQVHADRIAERIVQLGGAPNFSPEGLLTRSHAEYVEGGSLIDMIKEDLVAERIAIDSYREMAHYLGQDDSTSRRLMEEILAVEEEHADDLVTLLEELGPEPNKH